MAQLTDVHNIILYLVFTGGHITRRIFLTSALAAVASLTSKSSWFTTDSPAAMVSSILIDSVVSKNDLIENCTRFL